MIKSERLLTTIMNFSDDGGFVKIYTQEIYESDEPDVYIEIHPNNYSSLKYQFTKEEFYGFVYRLVEFQKVLNETIQSQTE